MCTAERLNWASIKIDVIEECRYWRVERMAGSSFYRKFLNSRFCARAMKMFLNVAWRGAVSPQCN